MTAGGPDNLHTVFTGDISGWTGDFIMASAGKTHHLELTGTSDVASKNIKATAGTLNVTVSGDTARTVASNISQDGGTVNLTASGTAEKTFSGTVDVNSVNATGGDLTFEKAVTVADTFSAGTVTAKGAMTLNGDSTADVIKVDGGSVAVNGSLTLNGENNIAYDKIKVAANATITTGEGGSLESDGVVYAKGAVITGGTAENLSAYSGGFSVAEGEITINAGNGNNADRDISVVFNGGDVTSNVTGTTTFTEDVSMYSFTGGKTTFSVSGKVAGDATFNGLLTLGGIDTLDVFGTLTLTNGLELLTKIDVTDVQETTSYTILSAGALVGLDTIQLDKVMTGTLADNVTAEIVFGSAARATTQDLVLQLTYTPVVPPTPSEISVADAAWVDANGTLKLILDGALPGSGVLDVLVSGEMWNKMVAAVQSAGYNVGSDVTLTLVDAAGNAIAMGDYTSIAFNGYAGEANGQYQMQFIPEPATATLSLLALAALAARRRRKH